MVGLIERRNSDYINTMLRLEQPSRRLRLRPDRESMKEMKSKRA